MCIRDRLGAASTRLDWCLVFWLRCDGCGARSRTGSRTRAYRGAWSGCGYGRGIWARLRTRTASWWGRNRWLHRLLIGVGLRRFRFLFVRSAECEDEPDDASDHQNAGRDSADEHLRHRPAVVLLLATLRARRVVIVVIL